MLINGGFQRIISNCRVLKAILPPSQQMSLKDVFSNQLLVVSIVKSLLSKKKRKKKVSIKK